MFLNLRNRFPLIKFVLASSSPRRKEIMEQLGFTFDVLSVPVDENLPMSDYNSFSDYVQTVALKKTEATAAELKKRQTHLKNVLLIGADTLIVHQDGLIGKPQNREDAISILSKLSGTVHQVITGVCLIYYPDKGGDDSSKDPIVCLFHEMTSVHMAHLSLDEIEAYVESGEPFDKAGAYGIQSLGASLVERIEGDYFNVVGLPACQLCRKIRQLLDQH